MEFTRIEKKAVVRIIEASILDNRESANNNYHKLAETAHELAFDADLLYEARAMSFNQAYRKIQEMACEKKKALVVILQKMAHSNIYSDKTEMAIIQSVFRLAGVHVGLNEPATGKVIAL